MIARSKSITPRTSIWPLYAFRREGFAGWTLAASNRGAEAAEAAARRQFGAVREFRALDAGAYEPDDPAADLSTVGEEVVSRWGETQWAGDFVWDRLAKCWVGPDEPIAPPANIVPADRLDVRFGQPDAGWIDLTLSAGGQRVEWPLSYICDPFWRGGLTAWLEAVALRGQARLLIDTEGVIAGLHALAAEADRIVFVGRSIFSDQPDLAVTIPRRRFVSDFYESLVAFWEGDEFRANWLNWNWDLSEEDDADEIATHLWQPPPIRSEAVERYLEGSEE